jgi:hypothetical protein
MNFYFDMRGIRFRVMMGHVPSAWRRISCSAAYRPVFWGDCERKTK